jgi:S-adenosylmethionine:tRNA ribosyltransferase-isomerase
LNVNPEKILVKDYTYELPLNRIAQHPLVNRDESKLLIYNKGNFSESIFKNVATYIPEKSLLIFNDTKVINARILFESPAGKQTGTGKPIEIFCLEPEVEKDIQLAFQKQGSTIWKCIVGNLKAWKGGKLEKKITCKGEEFALNAELIEKTGDAFLIRFSWTPEKLTFAEILLKFGVIPLPPYMKRMADDEDAVRYQTIYANPEGSVAAPTAGLHFTNETFASLKDKNIICDYLTLHVGAGTFKPVKSENISGHSMHGERFYVEKSTIENIFNYSGKVISVGTTSLRTIESLYWYGVRLINNKTLGNDGVFISQWEPYEQDNNITVNQSLEAVLNQMKKNNASYLSGMTEIIIVPGYEFKIINGLITNFHQPGSTLLLLIAAFIGNDWKMLYEYALNNDFRFLSYGDSSLLFR